jgi:glycogen debranching enzyme
MSKFTNAERIANYAIVEGLDIPAAELMGKLLLGVTLSASESKEAERLHASFKKAEWRKLEAERRSRMNDPRWID